jgi:hypothetical protein
MFQPFSNKLANVYQCFTIGQIFLFFIKYYIFRFFQHIFVVQKIQQIKKFMHTCN